MNSILSSRLILITMLFVLRKHTILHRRRLPTIHDRAYTSHVFFASSDSPDIRAVALCSTQHGFVVVLWMSSTPREKMCMRMTTYFTFYDLSKLYSFRLCLKVQSSKNIHLSFLASVPAVERSPGSWNDEWGLLLFMVLSYPCSFSRICEDLPMKSRSSWSTSIPQMIRWSDRRHSKLKSEMAISFYPPPWRFFSHPLLVAFPLD